MSDRVSPTTNHPGSTVSARTPQYQRADLAPEWLVVPYSALTIVTAYYSYTHASTFIRSMPKFLQMYQLPKVSSPQFCKMVRDLRNLALKMTVCDIVGAVAIAHLVPIPVYSRVLGVVAGLDGVLTLAAKFLEPKYCGDPNGKPKGDEDGDAVLEQLRAIVNGWNPQPAGMQGRYTVEPKKIYWEPDHVESDGVGTALTFLAALGAVAAAGVAAGASWSVETLMGAASRVPAFGY